MFLQGVCISIRPGSGTSKGMDKTISEIGLCDMASDGEKREAKESGGRGLTGCVYAELVGLCGKF